MEPKYAKANGLTSEVSIPERVWGGLEPSLPGHQLPLPPFQSLRGFGVGWSGWCFTLGIVEIIVSIPERVWGGLEPTVHRRITAYTSVSIPERVWGGLERP